MRPHTYSLIEEQRIDRLYNERILDTLDEAVFNKIAEDIAVILDVPCVTISFMDSNRQLFKSCCHSAGKDLNFAVTISDHVLRAGRSVAVSNALQDPRFQREPVVMQEPHIRSFLGVPMATPDGARLGSILALDLQPREFSSREVDILQRFANRVLSELEQRLLRAEYEQVNEELQTIMVSSPSGYLLIDAEDKIIGFNPAAERITGLLWQQGEVFNWKALKKDHKVSLSREEPVYARWVGQGWFQVSRISMPMKSRTLLVFEDITDHVEHQMYLQEIAFKDQVTAAENRNAFYAYLRSRFRSGPFAVAFLDLDHFKEVNDQFGHQAGDEALKEVARRLKSAVRTQDRVYRLAGDEFTLILGGDVSEETLSLVADRIMQVMQEPIDLGENQAALGISMGITRAIPGESVDDLLHRADSLMYQVKQAGRGGYRLG